MTTERIDIVITENGARVVKASLDDLSATAKSSNQAIINLTAALSAQERHTLATALGTQRLQKAYADTASASARAARARSSEAISLNKLTQEQDKTATAITLNANKIATAQELSATRQITANARLNSVVESGAARTAAIQTKSIAINDNILQRSMQQREFNASKIVSLESAANAKIAAIQTKSIATNDTIIKNSATRRAAVEAESAARIQLSAARTAEVQERAALRAAKANQTLGNSYNLLRSSIVGIGAGYAVNEIRKAADEYTGLQNKLRALGVAQGDLANTTTSLADISNKSFQSLEGTATLYARLIPAAKDLGASQNELFKFTQAASQAMTIFGTGGGTATGAMLQLSQAMSRGKVQAQEFRSLLDGMYPLLQVVANNLDGAGGSVAKLRQMMLDGKLTSKDFFDAAVKGAPELELAMLKMSPTTTQVLTVLRNQFVLAIGKFDEATGATRLFATAVATLSPYILPATVAVISLATAFGLFVGVPALLSAVNTQLVRMMVLLLANPLTAFLIALTAITTALVIYRKEIKLGVDETTTLADLFTALGNMASAAFDKISIGGSTLSKIWANFELPSFADWLTTFASFFDGANGILRAFMFGFIESWRQIPAVLKDTFYSILGDLTNMVNSASELLSNVVNKGFEAVGSDKRLTIDKMMAPENDSAGAAKNYFANVAAAASEGWNSASGFKDAANNLISESQRVAAARKLNEGQNKASDPNASTEGSMPAMKADKGAAAEARKFENALERLRDKYDGVYKAQSALRDGTALLDRAMAEGKLTLEERNKYVAQMTAELRDQADPLGAINRELDRERELLSMSNKERELSNQMYKITQDLLKQGVFLSDKENEALREKIALIQKEKEVSDAKNQILDQTLIKQEQELTILSALSQLKRGDLSQQQAANDYFINANEELMKGTAEYYQNERVQANQKKEYFDAAARDGVVSEQSAWAAKLRISLQSQSAMLGQANDFFGGISALQSSQNKKAASIGKAAAIAQATIATYQSATSAFAAMAGIPYVGPALGIAAAAAAVAAGMANVQAIRSQPLPGFAFGGAMEVGGTGGTDSQTVAFRATPGETVRVTTPSQESAANRQKSGGDTYNFVLPGVTNESDAKASSAQLQRSAGALISGSRRYR